MQEQSLCPKTSRWPPIQDGRQFKMAEGKKVEEDTRQHSIHLPNLCYFQTWSVRHSLLKLTGLTQLLKYEDM